MDHKKKVPSTPTFSTTTAETPALARTQILAAASGVNRIVVKAGTSVVSTSAGLPALSRIANIVEQCCELMRSGKQVLLVSSGAIGCGRRKMIKQKLLSSSIRDYLNVNTPPPRESAEDIARARRQHDAACAAAGQATLMSLYDSLFTAHDVSCSQLLVTKEDFKSDRRVENMKYSLEAQCKAGLIPIINENDAISANEGYTEPGIFSDNDSLAALIASNVGAELLLILTDVNGLYDRPPSKEGAKLIEILHPRVWEESKESGMKNQQIGQKSSQGRGGMEAKINAAISALDGGVSNVIVVNGRVPNTLVKACYGENVGTLITYQYNMINTTPVLSPNKSPSSLYQNNLKSLDSDTLQLDDDGKNQSIMHKANFLSPGNHENDNVIFDSNTPLSSSSNDATESAMLARKAQRALASLSGDERSRILNEISVSIENEIKAILGANARDLVLFDRPALGEGVSHGNVCTLGHNSFPYNHKYISNPLIAQNKDKQHLKQRLKLSEAKLKSVIKGARSLALKEDLIGKEIISRDIYRDQLHLKQVYSPIGVLLIIFEARPECLPQIVSLAIRAGCGVILKGGSEARTSNAILHRIVANAITVSTDGKVVGEHLIHLLENREQVNALLGNEHAERYIDIVIPRGSNKLVKHIQSTTRLPVLGHAAGVCHAFVDKNICLDNCIKLLIDAKTNYPAACNALETILFVKDLDFVQINAILMALRDANVALYGTTNFMSFLKAYNGRDVLPGLSIHPLPGNNLSTEWGNLSITLEVVDDIHHAIEHIALYGSGHTEMIITESKVQSETFLNQVDSACVFHNASTRFADGFRFGLGAEVGISTGTLNVGNPIQNDIAWLTIHLTYVYFLYDTNVYL
jgi:delta-1-pyrroline-5-carboxylate synthetase